MRPRTAAARGVVVSLAEIIKPDAPVRRFQPYPAYKDSGVEWLGEIPANWVASPLERVLLSLIS